MKVYTVDEKGGFIYDKNGAKQYFEITPCHKCERYRWEKKEKKALEKAIELMCLLVDFKCACFYIAGGSIGAFDRRHRFQLGELINPVREICRYDSDQIGLLKGILKLAGFAGTSEIHIEGLTSAYQKLRHFVAHLHNGHREGQTMGCVEPSYVDWVDPEAMFCFLPDIRDKSFKEIRIRLHESYDAIEADCMRK